MSRTKGPRLIENVLVEAMAAEGRCLSHMGEKVLFVEGGAVPGDLVDVEVLRSRQQWMSGRLLRVLKPSPRRIAPFCQHFGVCGGCKWQPVPYPDQAAYKDREVTENLRRIGHLELPPAEPFLAAEHTTEYRNKLEFTFAPAEWLTPEQLADTTLVKRPALGFHVAGRFDAVCHIQHCHLQAAPSNQLRNWLYNYALQHHISLHNQRQHEGLLRGLILRTASTGQTMAILIVYAYNEHVKQLLDDLRQAFPQLTSLQYVVNDKVNDSIADLDVQLHSGSQHITERLANTVYNISPKSFFQTNSQQAQRLYDLVKDYAALSGRERLWDLYCGTGSIGCYLAPQAAYVLGVEYVKAAIDDANINARLNNLNNCRWLCGDMKDILNADFVQQEGRPDVVVVDPPRAGMHPDVVDMLLRVNAPRIVYVSCNSATQARDLALLATNYRIARRRAVDMFPHTQHVESVVLLLKKE